MRTYIDRLINKACVITGILILFSLAPTHNALASTAKATKTTAEQNAIAGEKKALTKYVKSFVGSTNFGATNPGAVCPNGMMSVSPFNVMGSELNKYDKDSRWWSTPYCYENCFFTGFSHVNLSGVGCPDLGSLLVMPTTGSLQTDYHIYGSEYTNEEAEPGYYSVKLTSYDIKAEATASMRTSTERYTFPEGRSNIILNLGEGLTNESGAYVKEISENEIEGMKLMGTFCYTSQAVFPIYFVMRINKKPLERGFFKKQRPMTAEAAWDKDQGKYKIYTRYNKIVAGDDIGYFYSFDTKEGEQIEVSMGVSFTSCENARKNLDAEDKNFEEKRADAHSAWEEALSAIKVSGGTKKDKEVFYTALYHALMHPNIIDDVSGDYPEMESAGIGKLDRTPSVGSKSATKHHYTVFSLWDTCRNLHQLMTLLYPEKQLDMVRSMVAMYKESSWLPKWELYGRETFTMEGDPSIPVITDTYLKGLQDFDIESAYQGMLKSADKVRKGNLMRPDIVPYIEKGYIPLGYFAADFSGDNSVSHALEYYMADNALALLSKEIGKDEYAKKFRERSLGYKHYYSKESGTLRPIKKDGTFLTPFDPRQGENFEPVPGFHEGSAWNYTFYIPHDVEGLASLMGGANKFCKKLQMVFDEGLYDPANEPDIAYPYLFSRFKGHEWRTSETVHKLLNKYYTTQPDGIPGNDDTGTMSAWAVFAMIGIYPDCPGEPYYTISTPIFDKVEIKLNPKYCDGHDKLIITKNSSNSNRIKKISLGGKRVKNFRISHKALIQGGELIIKTN